MDSVKVLDKLISYKTDRNIEEINNCLKWIQKLLDEFGWKTELIKNDENNKQNLVAVLNGNLYNIKDGLLLAGHIDTVLTDINKWNSNPFKLTTLNNIAYGLGVADMKVFTASILANLKEISNLNTTKPIVFVLTNDEETVMFGINRVIKFLKENNIIPKYAIIGEPSNMQIATSNRGFYEFETVINGKSAHSSAPNLGVNSVYIMSKLISFIENLNLEYISKETTINVGLINGGTMCNVVPEKCTIRWDVRTLQKQYVNEIYDLVNSYLIKLINEYNGATFANKIVFKIPPFEYKQCKITKQIKDMFKIEEFQYAAATEAGFFQELGINCAILGCGNINDCHSINEKININDYKKYQKMLLKIIQEIC